MHLLYINYTYFVYLKKQKLKAVILLLLDPYLYLLKMRIWLCQIFLLMFTRPLF